MKLKVYYTIGSYIHTDSFAIRADGIYTDIESAMNTLWEKQIILNESVCNDPNRFEFKTYKQLVNTPVVDDGSNRFGIFHITAYSKREAMLKILKVHKEPGSNQVL